MKKILCFVLLVAILTASTFAGTYNNQTIDSDFGKSIAFTEMGKGHAIGCFEVTDELWGGFGNNLVTRSLDCNKDFKTGLITNYCKINGEDDSITVVEVKNGKVVKAIVYLF